MVGCGQGGLETIPRWSQGPGGSGKWRDARQPGAGFPGSLGAPPRFTEPRGREKKLLSVRKVTETLPLQQQS